MHPAFVLIAIISSGGLAAFLLLLRSLSKNASANPAAIQAGTFSADRYVPLASLLNVAEYEFLRTQPGFTSSVGRRFRAERRQICRQYLGMLRSDFSAVYSEANRLLLYSKQDRSDLASVLFQQRLRFAAGLVKAEVSLFLYRFRAEDIRFDELVRPVTAIQNALEEAVLAGAAA